MAEQLTTETFLTHVQYVRDDIRRLTERLDELNGRTRTLETKVAILEDRGDKARDPSARWGAFGAGIASLMTTLWQWFGK